MSSEVTPTHAHVSPGTLVPLRRVRTRAGSLESTELLKPQNKIQNENLICVKVLEDKLRPVWQQRIQQQVGLVTSVLISCGSLLAQLATQLMLAA